MPQTRFDTCLMTKGRHMFRLISIRWTATMAWFVPLMSVCLAADLPDPSEVKPVHLLTVPHYCEGVVFDHAGNGYISEGKRIVEFSPDGKSGTWVVTGAPNGHKVLADGTRLVCDASHHAVLHLSADGTMLEPASKECNGKPLRGPNDLTLDTAHGGFYFTDPGDSGIDNLIGTVHYVDRSGKTHLLDSGLAYPNLSGGGSTSITRPCRQTGALLAVLESKHGHVCGDGVNSTLVMRRSTDFVSIFEYGF